MFQSTLLYQDAIVKMNTASYIEKLIIQTEWKHQIAILTLYKEVKSCSESKSLLNWIEANKTLDAEIISHITKTNSRNRNLVKEMSDSWFSKLLDITKANVKQNQKSLIDARTKAINSREKTLSLIKEIKTIWDGTNVWLKQLNNWQTSKKIAKNA
jgi:ABC-type proline/glycine betaine transport system ATPase subunit